MNTIKFRWLCGVCLAALLFAPQALQAHWHIKDIAPAGVPGQSNIEAPLSGGYTGSDLSFSRLPDAWSVFNGLDPFAAAPPEPVAAPPDWLLVPHERCPQAVPEPGTFVLTAVAAVLARRRR